MKLDGEKLLKRLMQKREQFIQSGDTFETDCIEGVIAEIQSGAFDMPDQTLSEWVEAFWKQHAELEEMRKELARKDEALKDVKYQVQQSDHPAGLGIMVTVNKALKGADHDKR